MSTHFAVFRQVLEQDPDMLRQIRRGVEKEGLRVTDSDATLSQTRHPSALGSA